jgi:NAD+ kinase
LKKPFEKIARIGLIANSEKVDCRNLVRKAARLIQATGCKVIPDAATARLAGLKASPLPDAAHLTNEVDLLIVFGGDGTMLRVARETAGSDTPIVGINAGGLGFLTDIQAHQLPVALKQIFAGEIRLESRPLIEAEGEFSGAHVRLLALNDFVITRGAAPRLVELEVRINHELMTRYRCDGLIVSTPTGSTAYSLAAGGAVVTPNADVFELTPICAHTLSNRSVILGMSSAIAVKVLSERVETILTADGQPPVVLRAGDVVNIRRSQHSIRLLHLAGSSFFETLRRKLDWSGSHV